MRQAAILGIGQTKVDEQWDKSLREIGGEAAFAAMQDAGMEKVDSLYVGNMLSSMVNGQNHLGVFFSDWIGLWKQEAVKVEAACASGAAAFRAALDLCLVGDALPMRFNPERYRDLPDPFPAWRRADAA